MTKHDTLSYLGILAICAILVYGLHVLTQFVDLYASNSIQERQTTKERIELTKTPQKANKPQKRGHK